MKEKQNKINIRKEINLKIDDARNLPIISGVAMEFMSLYENRDSTFGMITEVISRDPALSAQILRVANSAFYGLRNKVGSLDYAIVLLGLKEVKNIVFMMSVFKMIPEDLEFSFDKTDYLKHSLLTAQAAKILSKALNLNFESSPFLIGLIHDIGKIFLDQNFHKLYSVVMKDVKKLKIPMYTAEFENLGITHSEVGSILTRKWNFPEDISNVILMHHDINNASSDKMLTSVIHVSDILTNSRNIGLPSPSTAVNIMQDPGWNFIEEEIKNSGDVDLEKILFQIDDELQNSEELLELYYPGKS
jgi:putative nucleotidyltransferase with HDIG domain